MAVRTTVYLPDDLKRVIADEAIRRATSEAEVIRETLRTGLASQRPSPRAGLFASGEPIARHLDEHLSGFGER